MKTKKANLYDWFRDWSRRHSHATIDALKRELVTKTLALEKLMITLTNLSASFEALNNVVKSSDAKAKAAEAKLAEKDAEIQHLKDVFASEEANAQAQVDALQARIDAMVAAVVGNGASTGGINA
jgi:chromosome segregation ATPase